MTNTILTIPENWKTKLLNDVAYVQRGTTITKKSANLNGAVPVVAGGVSVAYMHDVANRGTGVITVSGSGANAGFVNIWDTPIFASDCSTIESNEHAKQDFLYYYLQSIQQYIYDEMQQGAGQPHVYARDLKNIQIPIPPIQEQERIVGVLDSVLSDVDGAISHTEQSLQHTADLFQSILQQKLSNPDWDKKPLGEVAHLVRGPFGGSLKKAFFVPSGYAVYEQQHAIYNQFSNIRYFINDQKFNEMKRFEVLPNDLIMSCSGTIGKIAKVPADYQKGIINQALLKITAKQEILTDYLMEFMRSNFFYEQLGIQIKGGAIQNVPSVKIMKQLEIALPPLSEQHRIVAELETIKTHITNLQDIYTKKLAHLHDLKQSILQQAFRGEL